MIKDMKLILNMYEFFKSRYIEDSRDTILTEDEILKNIETKYPLLYLYDCNSYTETYGKSCDFIDKIRELGSEIKIKGWNYNLEQISRVLNKVAGLNLTEKDIVITNPELVENYKKRVTCIDKRTYRSYKLTIDLRNKTLVSDREYNVVGVNELLIDSTVINLDMNDMYTNIFLSSLNSNMCWISSRKMLANLKNIGLDKDFLRKWDKPNIMVNGYTYMDEYYFGCDGNCEECDLYDDEEDD